MLAIYLESRSPKSVPPVSPAPALKCPRYNIESLLKNQKVEGSK
jgi:hypothetical protein